MNNQIIPEELKEFQLKEYSFFDETIYMQLPEFFSPMSPEEYQKRFVNGRMQGEVLSSPQGSAILSFLKQSSGVEVTIESFIEAERAFFSRMIPGYVEFGTGTKLINGLNVGCIQYKSNAIDKDLYNIFFAFKVGDEIRCGLLMVPYDQNNVWTSIFLHCIDTLHTK